MGPRFTNRSIRTGFDFTFLKEIRPPCRIECKLGRIVALVLLRGLRVALPSNGTRTVIACVTIHGWLLMPRCRVLWQTLQSRRRRRPGAAVPRIMCLKNILVLHTFNVIDAIGIDAYFVDLPPRLFFCLRSNVSFVLILFRMSTYSCRMTIGTHRAKAITHRAKAIAIHIVILRVYPIALLVTTSVTTFFAIFFQVRIFR